MSPNTMSLKDCQGWLAAQDGWFSPEAVPEFVPDHQRAFAVGRWTREIGSEGLEFTSFHPYPPTLDAAAAAMPEGWYFMLGMGLPKDLGGSGVGFWCDAFKPREDNTNIRVAADTEILARFRLAVACRLAEKGTTNAQ